MIWKVVAVLVIAVWLAWSWMTKRELERYKSFERNHHIFSFAKSNDTYGRYLGDEITAFLEDHSMGKDAFCRDFIENPVRDHLVEYRRQEDSCSR